MTYVKATSVCPKLGRAAYLAGASLATNPYVVGTYCARMWADGWLAAWMASVPTAAGSYSLTTGGLVWRAA